MSIGVVDLPQVDPDSELDRHASQSLPSPLTRDLMRARGLSQVDVQLDSRESSFNGGPGAAMITMHMQQPHYREGTLFVPPLNALEEAPFDCDFPEAPPQAEPAHHALPANPRVSAAHAATPESGKGAAGAAGARRAAAGAPAPSAAAAAVSASQPLSKDPSSSKTAASSASRRSSMMGMDGDLRVVGGALEAYEGGDGAGGAGAWRGPSSGGGGGGGGGGSSDDVYSEDAAGLGGVSSVGRGGRDIGLSGRGDDVDADVDGEDEDELRGRCCRGRLPMPHWLQRLRRSSARKWRAILRTPTGAELAALAHVAAPICLGNISFNVVGMVNLVFLGHLGETELAAAAMGQLISNMSGNAVVVGMLSSMDTLCAQAYGAGNFKRVGIIAQRAAIVCCALFIPILIFWAAIGPVLTACGISEVTTSLSSSYLRVMMLNLPINTLFLITQKYMASQEHTLPAMWANLIGAALSIPCNALYVYGLGLGYLGPAWATVTTTALATAFLLGHVIRTGFYKRTWPGLSLKALRGLGEFVKLGLPGAGMTCAEWWGIELHTFISGMHGTAYLAAQALMVNLLFMMFMIPLGLGIAANVRVGAFLGANKPHEARFTTLTIIKTIAVVHALLICLIGAVHNPVGRGFTSAPNVLAVYQAIIPMFLVVSYFDGIQGCVAGVLRAASKFKLALGVNLLAYWVLALPLAYALAFHAGSHADYDNPATDPATGAVTHATVRGMGLSGQWLALMIGAFSVASIYLFIVSRLDWAAVAQEVSERERRHKLEAAAAEAAAAAADGAEREPDASGASSVADEAAAALEEGGVRRGGTAPAAADDAGDAGARRGMDSDGTGVRSAEALAALEDGDAVDAWSDVAAASSPVSGKALCAIELASMKVATPSTSVAAAVASDSKPAPAFDDAPAAPAAPAADSAPASAPVALALAEAARDTPAPPHDEAVDDSDDLADDVDVGEDTSRGPRGA